MKKNNVTISIIVSLSLIVSFLIVGNSIKNRNSNEQVITVTGLAERDFESDLIVWKSSLNVKEFDLTASYAKLKKQTETTRKFLLDKGIKPAEINVSTIDFNKDYRYNYHNGVNTKIFEGYSFTQNINVTSNDIVKIETISRQITELINSGIEINSYAPRYYYTKLADLKIEMLSDASKDAYNRASTIAESGNGKIGKLIKSSMGVFQIIAKNSTEEYSWGGTYNTSAKHKTATVTVRSQYLSK